MTEDTRLKILKLLEQNPQISQRQLASELGYSLGKVNYCLKALMGKGLVKAKNFKTSVNKRAYVYVLTPRGMEEKVRISVSFLKRKLQEYDALKVEIEQLQREISHQ